jgi:short-subunit dehydrogenase
MAGAAWWHTAEEVVEASIEGLRRRKLFVVPGWRYKLLTGIVTKLPARLRLQMEAVTTRARSRRAPLPVSSPKELPKSQ